MLIRGTADVGILRDFGSDGRAAARLVRAALATVGRPFREPGRLSLSVRDTGAFPEPVVARAQREFRSLGSGLEFHVHLPPSPDEGRATTIADLTIGVR
jgi:hypothetical protein